VEFGGRGMNGRRIMKRISFKPYSLETLSAAFVMLPPDFKARE
jgi:hypothetical protein